MQRSMKTINGPALFFFVDGVFLIHDCTPENGEDNGSFINYPFSHMWIWEKHYQRQYRVDFDYYPRGRIIYRKADSTYLLYYDKCIGDRIGQLVSALPGGNVVVDFDEHYQCHQCNEFYVV